LQSPSSADFIINIAGRSIQQGQPRPPPVLTEYPIRAGATGEIR
jgi:hypothetical protein